MKRIYILSLALITCTAFAGQQQRFPSLQERCMAASLQFLRQQADAIAQLPAQEQEAVIAAMSGPLPMEFIKNLASALELPWQVEQIKEPVAPERTIIQIDGKRVLERRPHGICGDPRESITDLIFSFDPAYEGEHGKERVLFAQVGNNRLQSYGMTSKVCIEEDQLPYPAKLKSENYENVTTGPHTYHRTPNKGKRLARTTSAHRTPETIRMPLGNRSNACTKNKIQQIIKTPEGRHLIITSSDSIRKVPTTPYRSPIRMNKRGNAYFAQADVSYSTGQIISYENNEVVIRNKELEVIQRMPLSYFGSSIAVSPFGNHAAVGLRDGAILLLTHPNATFSESNTKELLTALVAQRRSHGNQAGQSNSRKRLFDQPASSSTTSSSASTTSSSKKQK